MAKPDQQSNLVDSILSGPPANQDEIALRKRLLELEIKQREIDLEQGEEYRRKQIAVADIAIQQHKESERLKQEQQKHLRQMQKDGSAASLKKMQMDKLIQERCTHRHPESNQPNTVGLRLMGGRITINCGRCGMVDTGSNEELMRKYGDVFPKSNAISGPLPPGSEDLLAMMQ